MENLEGEVYRRGSSGPKQNWGQLQNPGDGAHLQYRTGDLKFIIGKPLQRGSDGELRPLKVITVALGEHDFDAGSFHPDDDRVPGAFIEFQERVDNSVDSEW